MPRKISEALAEELALCYDDPLRFVLWAFPWGERPETSIVELPEPWASRYPGCKYGPDRWACELLEWLRSEVQARGFDGRHSVTPIKLSVASGHGIGKAISNEEIVDTPSGKKRWGDIRAGDLLWGPDGKPTKVVAIPFDGVRPCYRVTFDDGSSTVVSGEHLWTVKGRSERRFNRPWVTLETKELLAKGVKRKNGKAVARSFEIPQHSALDCPPADLPVDPYVMGLFLGNGGRISASITTDDREVIEEINRRGYSTSEASKRGTTAKAVRVYGLRKKVRELGLLACYSYEKYIPDNYKNGSAQQRLELLRGLIDTDGTVNAQGSIIYSTCSKKLAEDVVWLTRSLGGKSRIQPGVKKPFYRDKSGARVDCLPCYNITITLPSGVKPCYVKRKLERWKGAVAPRYLSRWIDSIEYVGDHPCKCVTVDRSDGLFLANDFIVTHNSCITAWLVCWIMATRPNCKGVITANTASQLETKTWAEITKWMKKSLVADMFDYKSTSITSKEAPESWRVDALTCREENAEAFAGQHSASSTPFYIFDEASAIPEAIYDVAEGGLTDGEPMMFLFGNPTRNSGRFFETFHKRRKYWKNWVVDSRSVAITNKQQIAAWAEEYGEDSDFFKVRVKGEFPSSSTDQFIPLARIRDAMARGSLQTNAATCAVVGVDVARFGDDDTVIATRIGRDATIPLKRYHGLDTVQVVGRVKEHVKYLRQKLGVRNVHVFVDEGGVGGGPVDILKADGFPVRGVNFSQSPDDPDRYPGKREEMWGRMAEWLKEGSIPDDRDLEEDLVSPTYTFDVKGRQKLESKKDMKKRGLRSPDSADALALTFAYRVNEFEGEYSGKRDSNIATSRRDYNPFVHMRRNFW